MGLWLTWYRAVRELRCACSHTRTFFWMVLALAGMSIRTDNAGVTSIVRALGLTEASYHCLLHFYHSSALPVDRLRRVWANFVLARFPLVRIGGHVILIGDGIKIAKEGRKMPAVKKLHQSSQNNTKPAYIFGHSQQAIGVLAGNGNTRSVCVPLVSQIHEGVVLSNRDRRTLLDKLVILVHGLIFDLNYTTLLVLDAYYASGKVLHPQLAAGHHVLVRTRHNTVAYEAAIQPVKRRRGRPRVYGKKVRLRDLWNRTELFVSAPSPVYGETHTQLRYCCVDLLWRPLGKTVRFVLVDHPHRGRCILLCTDLAMTPLDIIRAYGFRFKIEVGFKQAIHTLGTYAYHFWMMGMKPLSRAKSGNQYLHHESADYRRLVLRKLDAYDRFVQIGCIAHGLLQYLALHHSTLVWKNFRSWLRTMRPELAPSEAVVAQALRCTLPEFLVMAPVEHELKKFIEENTDFTRSPLLIAA